MSKIYILGQQNSTLKNTPCVGNKAFGLLKLEKAGFNVPPSVILPENFILSPFYLLEIMNFFASSQRIIIRSSSNLEDGETTSFAGAFKSIIVENQAELELAVKRIREHANKYYAQIEIAVIFQEVIDGLGGVYLFDSNLGSESIEISLLGTYRITSGFVTRDECVTASSYEYHICLSECRKLAAYFNQSCDIEFVFTKETGVVFLQYRKLTGNFFSKLSVSNNILAEYFSRPLDKLCGDLWQTVLAKVFSTNIEFNDGFLFCESMKDEKTLILHNDEKFNTLELQEAIDFYKQVLFPRWELLASTITNLQDNDPVVKWEMAYKLWESFYIDYFLNPHEKMINQLRESIGAKVARAPVIIEWLKDVKLLNINLANNKKGINFSEPYFIDFLKKYGHRFIDPHYFSEPSLAEEPQILLRIISGLNEDFSEINIYGNKPSLELRVAWLAFEDNEYKHLVNKALRKIILELVDELSFNTNCVNAKNVWSLSLQDFNRFISKQEISSTQLNKVSKSILTFEHSTKYALCYQADILSVGSVEGIVERDPTNVNEKSIFVTWGIDTFDYPIILKAAGVIVAHGGQNSHYALFARDYKKPLFCCINAVRDLPTGLVVSLLASSKEIRVK